MKLNTKERERSTIVLTSQVTTLGMFKFRVQDFRGH